eukprot:scaffold7675_cov277-Pinguiococcus_pyrenoidosus.AAC.5
MSAFANDSVVGALVDDGTSQELQVFLAAEVQSAVAHAGDAIAFVGTLLAATRFTRALLCFSRAFRSWTSEQEAIHSLPSISKGLEIVNTTRSGAPRCVKWLRRSGSEPDPGLFFGAKRLPVGWTGCTR